jgi:DNA-binding response OmpR family regulator
VKDCYSIQITFQQSSSNNAVIGYAGLGIGLLFAGFLFIRKDKKSLHTDASFVPLGSYSFSFEKRALHTGDSVVPLTDKESKLLSVLAAHPNQPIDRDQLMKQVWEDDGVIVGRSLDVFISRLRKKFHPSSGIKLVSIHGKGYKLEVQ